MRLYLKNCHYEWIGAAIRTMAFSKIMVNSMKSRRHRNGLSNRPKPRNRVTTWTAPSRVKTVQPECTPKQTRSNYKVAQPFTFTGQNTIPPPHIKSTVRFRRRIKNQRWKIQDILLNKNCGPILSTVTILTTFFSKTKCFWVICHKLKTVRCEKTRFFWQKVCKLQTEGKKLWIFMFGAILGKIRTCWPRTRHFRTSFELLLDAKACFLPLRHQTKLLDGFKHRCASSLELEGGS